MNYLYIVIVEGTEECMVSKTEQGVRTQVNTSLAKRNIPPPTDDEWEACTSAEPHVRVTIECPDAYLITYYKIESKLGAEVSEEEAAMV